MTDELKENLMANISQVREELSDETRALEKEIAKLRDPTVHAAIMMTAARERENGNRILKTLLARLDAMELNLQRLEERAKALTLPAAQPQEVALSDVDKTVVSLIKDRKQATAEDIQTTLRYKGRNAACARLNRLFELGVLSKQRSGKKILYSVKE